MSNQEARAVLSSPAPDRLSAEERATIEIARTIATKLSETQANVFPVQCNAMMQSGHRTVAALLAIIDRFSRQPSRTEELTVSISEQAKRVCATFEPSADKIVTYEAAQAARQPEAEPVAWLRDLQPDAEHEALAVCNRIDPGAFPVYTSPRLDREKIAQILLDRFLDRGKVRRLGGAPTFPDGTKIADLPPSYKDDFLADADAIMRETR